MSSLAKQLKQLQIPGILSTSQQAKASKRASLLFDAKEAAGIDTETVYSLGLNGLEGLKVIDQAFSAFENSLFGESSKSLERTVQSKEVNEKLDKHISKFLQYLSPYILLKPAHKALEWLIRRFQIHIFNVDDLVSCILPYHETNLFARVLQLVSIGSPSSKWHWLYPVQKAGVPLSKTALLQHCISDSSFLSQICDMVKRMLRSDIPSSSFRVLFAFYTSTVVGSLELMGSVSERFLTLLLPYILDGLKSGVSELVASSYMIIAQLCSMCSMNEGLVKSLVDCICKHIDSGLAAEGLSCLTFICQSQGIKKLSKRSFKALVKLAWLVKIGSQLSSTHDINPLLQVFLPQLISTGLKDCLTQDQSVPVTTEPLLEIALNLLKEIELESDLVVLVGRTLISGYCSARDKLGDNDTELQDLHEKIRGLIQLLEKRYPVELEKAIGGHLGSLKAAEETGDEDASPVESQSSLWTMDLVSLALTGVKSQVIVDSNTTLVISLHHPQAEVRQMAVKRLGQLLNAKESLSEDAHFVVESLLNRLQDEDPDVVASVLNLGQVLVKSVPGIQLVEHLFKLLNNRSSQWDEVRNKSTVLLLGEWVSSTVPSLTDQVVFGLLPLFFLHHPVCKTALPLSVTASKSAVASCHPLLSGMKDFVKTKEWKSCDESSLPESLAAANSLLINWLSKNLMKMDEKQGIQLVHRMTQHAKKLSDNSLFHPLLQCLLGRVIALTTGQYKLTLCEVFTGLVLPDVWKITKLQGTYESIEGADSASEPVGVIPVSLLTGLVRLLGKRSTKRVAHARAAITLWLCKDLLKNMPAVKTASSGVWWSSGETDSPENIYSKLLVSLLEVSAFGSSTSMSHQVAFKQLLQDLIEFHLPDKLALLKFLAHLWSTDLRRGSDADTSSPGISALLQVQCLHIASACLGSLPDKTIKQLSKSTCAVIPSLLVPLCSPISAVRRSAISCVKSFGACLTSVSTCPVTSLISVLTNNAQELTADPQHLQRVLTEYFAPLMSSVKPKSKHAAEVKTVGNTLNFILQHITSDVTPTHVKRILLSSLSGVVTQDLLRTLLPLLLHLLDQCSEEGGSVLSQDDSILLQLVVKKLTPATAPLLQPDSQPWKVMLRVLSMRRVVCPGHPAPIIVLLEQISNRFFQAIPAEELQRHLFKLLLDALLETKNVVIGNSIKTTIMTLSLTANLITKELYQFNVREENEPKKKKLKKTHPAGDGGHDDAHVTRQLQRSTVILELLQHKINVVEQHKLVPTLFAVLRRCIELDHSQSSSEYIMQLIFSVINNICHKLSPDGSPVTADFLPEDQFDVELIVQCIRSSESPQTHNQALLLLAKAAQLFPEKVLHNVMSIFTFMGASVLRQDDTYSFQVITKTLDTVIPALIQAGEKQQLPAQMSKKDPVSLADIVGMLIRVFVDASPHVPEHRQLPLFTHLVSTVGSTQFLHITLILLLEKHVVHGSTAPEDKEPAAHSPLGVDFCLSLFHSFDPGVQVEAILQLLQYIDHLPFEKPEGRHKPRVGRKTPSSFLVVTPLFDVDTHSAKHLRQFKYASVSLVSSLLSSEGFVNKVHDQGKKLNSLFMRLLEETLNFVTRTAQHAEDMAQDTTGKFWRALLHKAYDIIDKINLLLAPSVFFGVIQKLLQSSNVTVRRKAMELLNSKLSQSTGNYPDDQVDALLSLVTELLVIAKGTAASEESVVNRQTALYSLKLLSRLLAKKHPDPFKEVISAAMKVFSSKDANVQVASSALLCVAEVVGGLQAHAIPFLPKLMPSVLKLLRRTGKDGSGLLTLCGITALLKTTEALPHFLSPYLVDMLVQVTSPSLNGVEVTEGHEEEGGATKQSSVRAQLKDRLESLRKELACKISPRVLISAVSQCYDQVLDTEKESVSVLMSLLAESVNSMSKEDIKSYQSQLFNLFLVALDFRAHHTHEDDGDLVDKTEGSVIEAFLCLIVKLSEASFRPMFLRVMDWATRTSSNKERLLVFYRLCDNVAGKLKGLFVLFAGYIVKNCASLLNATNTAKTEETLFEDVSQEKGTQNSCELLSHLLDCLYKCLMYDTHGFLDNDRFQCLMQPLVDQIENPLGGEEKFKERLSHHLVPCLAQFAVACGNDAQWKPLNYQVLLKTRHSSAPVRFAALKVLEGFHSRLGEDFMVLLPETIPFLAELMEDECFEVEQQCQHVISEIEEVLGESLQKYF